MPLKSSPLDEIPTKALKSCLEMFAELITRLITLSFEEGKFPEMYKCASVTPLLKKQELDADLLSNYRPVSNLHTISKIVERVFMTRLAEHVKLSTNYNRFQSAYRRGHSTETALLRLLNDLYSAADNGFRTVLVQLDLTAAFDTIDISTLLCRLCYFFGISGPALNWISSYVVGRTQFVRVGQEQSPRTDCEYGVPQGSVFGPLLFTLYISPVASVISSFGIDHAQYADDTQLYVALKDESLPALTQCIKALYHWLDCHGLCLNPEKTEAVVLDTTSRQRAGQQIDTLDTGTGYIKTSDCVKSLGVLIECTISFNQHVNKICKSSYYHIKAMRHIRKLMTLLKPSLVPWLPEDSTTAMQSYMVLRT